MQTLPLTPLALIACAALTTACVHTPPVQPHPPRLTLPPDKPCEVHILPEQPTLGDLEAGYIIRGSQIVTCEAWGRLILENWQAERAMQDQWQAPKRRFGIF